MAEDVPITDSVKSVPSIIAISCHKKTRTMGVRIPGAAVVAAFLLFGTGGADAFQPHSRVSATARPSRTMRPNGSELDMMSVLFGRDVQVRVSEGDREKPLVACVDSGTICTVAENTDAVRPMHVRPPKEEDGVALLGTLWSRGFLRF